MSTQALTQVVSEKLDFIVLPRINLRKILIPGLILIDSLIIFYIFQINEVTKISFLIYKQEAEIAAVSQQIRDSEAGLLAENSLIGLDNIFSELNYEKVSKVYYIQVLDNGVAVQY